jgi:hypothetical protein
MRACFERRIAPCTAPALRLVELRCSAPDWSPGLVAQRETRRIRPARGSAPTWTQAWKSALRFCRPHLLALETALRFPGLTAAWPAHRVPAATRRTKTRDCRKSAADFGCRAELSACGRLLKVRLDLQDSPPRKAQTGFVLNFPFSLPEFTGGGGTNN